MRKKMLIFIICSLLIINTTTFALTSYDRDEQQIKQVFLETEESLSLAYYRWMKTIGGLDYDESSYVKQTSDGGYIITGTTWSYGAGLSDIWLIKTDKNGDETWNKTFGGTGEDEGFSMQQTNDGGYIITGITESFGAGKTDIWLIKTDSNGNKLWDKTFGGTEYDNGRCVQQTSDGGYIITGETSSFDVGGGDVWLIKTDNNGDKVWEMTLGGTNYECSNSVQETSDEGYIITGVTWSYDYLDSDIWLIKIDKNGKKIWDKTYGGKRLDGAYSIQKTTNDEYIIIGYTWLSYDKTYDVWLIKIDSNGTKLWDKTYGGISWDEGCSVQQANDGGYIIIGKTHSFGAGDLDVWLIKTNANGSEIWNKTFGGTNWDEGCSVQQTTDDGYIITGTTSSFGAGYYDVWLIKTDSQGKATNQPPDKPLIAGKSSGKPGTEYQFKFVSIDPDGDEISYYIDWGDNTSTGWTTSLPSCEYYNSSHIWTENGNFTIKAKAKDMNGAESEWTTDFISISKSKTINVLLFLQKLFQRYPIFEKILNQLL